ncbi:MAG: hypothetical protein ACR2PL_04380 [Dehalococcoidia bacterium]
MPGLNEIAYLGPTLSASDALATIAGQYNQVLRFDSATQQWLQFDPSQPDGSDFQMLDSGGAYVIRMLGPATLVEALADQPPIPALPPLSAGYNYVVYGGPTASLADAFNAQTGQITAVWRLDPLTQTYRAVPNVDPAQSGSLLLQHNQTYFLYMTGDAGAAP